MNHIRLIEIINAYGTHSGKWPREEREAAMGLLTKDLEAQSLISKVRELDIILDKYRVSAQTNLRTRILNNIPRRFWFDRFIDWVLPSTDGFISNSWRPILVGSLPLIVGLIVGNSLSTTEVIDSWEDEISLVSLSTANTGGINE